VGHLVVILSVAVPHKQRPFACASVKKDVYKMLPTINWLDLNRIKVYDSNLMESEFCFDCLTQRKKYGELLAHVTQRHIPKYFNLQHNRTSILDQKSCQ